MSVNGPVVSVSNYVRAESDSQMSEYVGKYDCLGRLVHSRAPYDVMNQVTVRGNRETLYSFSVLELPSWDQEQVESVRSTLAEVGALATDSSKMFGRKDELDPVYWTLGAAVGWGGLPAHAAMYGITFPERNDGATAYTLTVSNVPVDAFWSVTLYDDQGWMPVNEYDAYSYNSVTAQRNDDDSVTIAFGGDPGQPNFLPIVKGWNYIFRTYRPQQPLLDGTWAYPEPKPVN